MTSASLRTLRASHDRGEHRGVVSICSAHPLVIRAALEHGLARNQTVLIEATCNQVNQDGGYTGMTPLDFRRLVMEIAASVGFEPSRLILGGDHLGPNPWKSLPADAAMAKADTMIAAYAEAGFTKLHLDASMGCLGEPAALSDQVTAQRAARLARVAETASAGSGHQAPVYVIGTEVPIPGGALEAIAGLDVTRPDAVVGTAEANRAAFAALGLETAFERVIAIVVQPGVEFGNENVIVYDRALATDLSRALKDLPQLVYEAHSTDYQPRAALSALVQDGFAILKVGPGLTFALREAIYGLESIAAELDGMAVGASGQPQNPGVRTALEAEMLRDPRYWQSYYHGSTDERAVQRHFSYSDRLRYYWPQPAVMTAFDRLMAQLGTRRLPAPLIRQYLGALAADGEIEHAETTATRLIRAAIFRVLDDYAAACGQKGQGSAAGPGGE